MPRPLLIRGLVLVASTTAMIVGCSGSSPEGDLPKTRVAQPGEIETIQKEYMAKKIAEGKYKPPPAVTIPKK